MSLLFLNAAFLSKEQFLFLHYMFSLSSDFNINTFCCSQYRSYNKGIPSYFLSSRQAPGIRLQLFGKADDCSGIWFFRNYPPKERLFLVLIFTNNLSKCYKVYFGNEDGCQNIAAVTKIKQVICADFFLQVLKNFHHGHSILKFHITESILINKVFFIRKKVAKGSGLKTVKNLSKCLATS